MVKSRLQGFYRKSLKERLNVIGKEAKLTEKEKNLLLGRKIDLKVLDAMSENAVGVMQLPLSIATNFKVNGRELLIPMAIEESSVVAAASNAAKLALPKGFIGAAGKQLMIGQIQVTNCSLKKAANEIKKNKKKLIKKATDVDKVLKRFGGGCRDIQARMLGKMLVIHLIVDVRDAMGANAVNSMCEALAGEIEEITGGRVRIKILSNLAVHRVVEARAVWKKKVLGEETIKGILNAYKFAKADEFRAVTHNKGIMNGIDAVVIATGNDFRAVEAGAHAFASLNGKYKPLTKYERKKNGDLQGTIRMPLALGIVGGATKVNPTAKISMKILGVKSAKELAEVVAAVGLAQNFAALKALATTGIQAGHMKLHARNIALQAGVKGGLVDKIARQLIEEKNISQARAEELLRKFRNMPTNP